MVGGVIGTCVAGPIGLVIGAVAGGVAVGGAATAAAANVKKNRDRELEMIKYEGLSSADKSNFCRDGKHAGKTIFCDKFGCKN